jgi:hypothetical protein
LKTKLTETWDMVPRQAREILGFGRDEWIDEAKSVRNNLAHTGSHVRRRAEDAFRALERVDARTRSVLTLALICQLGVDEAALVESAASIRRHHRLWVYEDDADSRARSREPGGDQPD